MPGLVHLPRYLLGLLSPRARLAAYAVGVIALAGLVIAAIVLIPKISETKENNAAQDRRERAARKAAERQRLIREQRPRVGTLGATGATAALGTVEHLVTADARRRFETQAKFTECRSLTVRGRSRLLSCTAVTTDAKGGGASRGVRIGYPYRAMVDLRDGRYGICKVSGQAGEGSLGLVERVPLPRACGG